MLLDGYVRVSRVGPRGGARFISPSLQGEQIRAWAATYGHTVGEVYEELDESGARADRPLLMRAISRIEQGQTQGLVVAKLDRFGRSLVDSLAAIERIRSAGGTFVSVQDGIDLDSDTGQLVAKLLFTLGEWELSRIRTGWADARARAIARGVHIAPVPPVGYRRRSDGHLVPDPPVDAAVTEAFRRRADREPLAAIGRFMESQGVMTPWGNRGWIHSTVKRTLANRVYLGEVRHGAFVNPNAHQPLIDPATWQAAQWPLELLEPRRGTIPSLLGGLLRCAACQLVMAGSTNPRQDGRPWRSYKCVTQSPRGHCPAPAVISASVIEPFLESLFFRCLERTPRGRGPVSAREVARLERDVADAEEALIRYRDNDRAAAAVGPERFAAGLERRSARVERALLAVAAARTRAQSRAGPDLELLNGRWPALSTTERRTALGQVFDCVFIHRGCGPPTERVHVCLRGEAPPQLPKRGDRHVQQRAFDPHDCHHPTSAHLRVRGARQWSGTRVRSELKAFLGEREAWPLYAEFAAAGQLRLYEQLRGQGGPKLWAEQLGLAYLPEHRRPPLAWTEDRVHHALAAFLDGKAEWPSWMDFRAARLTTLRRAVNQHGGAARWADEFGLKLGGRKQSPRAKWTDARITEAAAAFAAETGHWPSRGEFERAQLSGLYQAMRRRKGLRYWQRKTARRRGPRGRPT